MTDYTRIFASAIEAIRTEMVADTDMDTASINGWLQPQITLPILAQLPEGQWQIYDTDCEEGDWDACQAEMDTLFARTQGHAEETLAEWDHPEHGYGGVSKIDLGDILVVDVWGGGCPGASALGPRLVLRR